MKISKTVINQILGCYSVRSKEFEPLEGINGAYKSRYVKDYLIKIKPEMIGQEETGRIIAIHTDGKGKRTFIDVWEKDRDGGYFWKFRNQANVPLSDAESFRDLEKELETVKAAARKQREELERLRAGLNKRPVGRPIDQEKESYRRAEVKKMLDAGYKDMEIIQGLKLCKGTYYRIKKIVQS